MEITQLETAGENYNARIDEVLEQAEEHIRRGDNDSARKCIAQAEAELSVWRDSVLSVQMAITEFEQIRKGLIQ